jgi:hypothetical protein
MTDEPSPLAAMTLAWSNIYASPHHSVWGTQLPVRVAGLGVPLDLRAG